MLETTVGKNPCNNFRNGLKTASHPELVSDVFLWRWSSNSDADVLRLNKEKYQLEAADWPPNLGELSARLAAVSANIRMPDPSRLRNRFPGSENGRLAVLALHRAAFDRSFSGMRNRLAVPPTISAAARTPLFFPGTFAFPG